MLAILRIFFWPILLGVIAVSSYILHLPLWPMFWSWFTSEPTAFGFATKVASILLVVALFRYAIIQARFTYAWIKGKKLVALKVILPRNDSKIDQEKRTEKDFKEKIAAMEQLFRALNEVKDLSFWQVIHFWITRYITISFELYVENGLIAFYVLCPKDLASIVEKQITSFYPNADVSPRLPPEIWPKGMKLVAYNMVMQKPF
jgi:hypothetical protein